MNDTSTAVEIDKAPREAAQEPTTNVAAGTGHTGPSRHSKVTFRCFALGAVLTALVAFLNCLMATSFNVHSIGGIQMPFGAIFVLFALTLFSLGLRKLGLVEGFFRAFSPTELLTIYSMVVIGGMISTPGCDNAFMCAGSTLFYFSTPENGWANLFYKYVPSWFAPGWDGTAYKKEIIDPIYLGNVKFADIPWHAWTMMLTAWSIFLGLVYSMLFFIALLFRKQWTQREALAFPLIEVPMQMAGADGTDDTNSVFAFWGNRVMWAGLILALLWHGFRGMNALYPDWPIASVNSAGSMRFEFPDKPWSVIPPFYASVYLGGIGLAYLLTREVSFSFWFFYLFLMAQFVMSERLGFQIGAMEKAGIMGRPGFTIYQAAGGWFMMAAILVFTAREYLTRVVREAFGANRGDEDEPFSPRFMVFGFILSFAGLIAWSWFAGINLIIALTFFTIFVVTSLVLTRVVIEGGFMFPQPPYYTIQMMSQTMFGSTLGGSDMLKLSFLQPTILVDMRTNVLPAFLHTMKMAEVLKLDRNNLRKLLISIAAALVLTMAVTLVTSVAALYIKGGLASYTWFTKDGPITTLTDVATSIKNPKTVDPNYIGWMIFGAAVVYLMVVARSRFLWFPLHPLGFLMAPTYPITQLWFSLFCGWLIKTMVMKYGGSDTYVKLRPFMIGLIFGNIIAMLFWVTVTFWKTGAPVSYWPA